MNARAPIAGALTAILLWAAPSFAANDGTPGSIELEMPPASGRAAVVGQIGHADVAQISQSAANAYAEIRQDGERNEAAVEQRGSGSAHVEIRQTGDFNRAGATQRGSGQNVLYVTQTGSGNRLVGDQTAEGTLHNGAILTQIGYGNDMMLTQDGSDNRAVLAQAGSGNEMAAAQNGDGNRLIWSQDGNNLPNLGVTQTGGQAVQITQTGGQ
ncbi:hypothetical protein [Sphingosinicella sp. CPCC 101087]|uniref:hypothetical protein n=1 Tax=Sphingosinicella sp. CPCC 101087 TaxID=2497754 RepID=UPI00101CBEAB|nr:hypothetical protein [Sphingosinicella sp. CPCC 101087]